MVGNHSRGEGGIGVPSELMYMVFMKFLVCVTCINGSVRCDFGFGSCEICMDIAAKTIDEVKKISVGANAIYLKITIYIHLN